MRQSGTARFFITFFIFIIGGAVLFFGSSFFRNFFQVPALFISSSFAKIGNSFSHTVGAILNPSALIKENDLLKFSVSVLEARNAEMESLREENSFLRSQLSIPKRAGYSFIEARVLGQEINTNVHLVMVDAGLSEGVKEKSTVIAQSGLLVGRVVKVEEHSSVILLISDPASRIAARVIPGASGVLVGQLDDEILFDLVPHGKMLKENDTVVTSGIDGLYIPDIPVGKIMKVTTKESDEYQRALLEPFVDLKEVLRVFILIQK